MIVRFMGLFTVLALTMGLFSGCILAVGGSSSSTASSAAPGTIVYVSPNTGSDTATGLTTNAPVKTIQKALQVAAANSITKIYVNNSGKYTNGDGLTSDACGLRLDSSVANMEIVGGYNNDFSAVWGWTLLDGKLEVTNVVAIDGANGVILRNFMIANSIDNGSGSVWDGGGLMLNNAVNTLIDNCFITNNVARKGGGVYINAGNGNKLTNCVIGWNQSYVSWTAGGAGIYMAAGANNAIVNCRIINNFGNNSICGGIVVTRGTNNGIYNCLFTNNECSSTNGTEIFLGGAEYATDPEAGLKNFVISGNTLKGNANAYSIAIAEELGTFINVTNHTIINNTIWTNSFFFLYRDSRTNGAEYLLPFDTNMSALNDITSSGAATASGNTGI